MAKVLIARVSRGSWETCAVGDWLVSCYADDFPENHPGVTDIRTVDQEPTPCARNNAVGQAQADGVDIIMMCDNDMRPSWNFYRRAVLFLTDPKYAGPTAIGSPYCGAAPHRQVQVIHTEGRRYTRLEASTREGIEQVASMGTGVIAFNMACFDVVPEPWFEYEYEDHRQRMVKATEDIVFCNKLNKHGGRVFVDWQSWSGHEKAEVEGQPGVDQPV